MSNIIRYEVRVYKPNLFSPGHDEYYHSIENFGDNVVRAESYYDELIDSGTDCKVELLQIEVLDEWVPGDDIERGN